MHLKMVTDITCRLWKQMSALGTINLFIHQLERNFFFFNLEDKL